ncbi:COG3650 family protein [Lysobacter fragariae]
MRILPVVLCVATSLLVACPRSTQVPTDTPPVSTAQSPAMKPAAPAANTPTTLPPGAQGKRAAGEENAPVTAWRGLGNEPFWSARVDGETLVFSTPEDQEGKTMQGRRVPSLVGYVFIGRDGDTDFNLTLNPGGCSDGMSDNRYQFTASFSYGDTTYNGCGELAK